MSWPPHNHVLIHHNPLCYNTREEKQTRRMNLGQRLFDKKILRWIRLSQLFFYVCFVILWFKSNFHPLKNLKISYLFALVPLLVLTGLRLFPRIREWKSKIPRSMPKEAAILFVLLLAAVVFRLPQLVYPSGMMSSDDAIPALMGKHIAEGRVPPVCFYGQLYMGSLCSHYLALIFKVFGYSILVLRCATILIYLAFMTLLYLFLKDVFSSSFGLLVSFFFALPFPHLVVVSIDNTSAYALVLLLGTAILYLSYLVAFKAKEKWLAPLGFLIGTAFWTHQVTAGFILTGLLVLLPRIKLQIKKYLLLLFSALIGFLPQLLAEAFYRFQLLKFLRVGEEMTGQGKMKTSFKNMGALLAASGHSSRYIFLVLLFAGFFFLVLRAWKKKDLRSGVIFSLFFLVFYLLYILSYFSSRSVIRYTYPLYVSVPVLLLAPLLAFRPRLRNTVALCFIAILFIFYNLQGSVKQVRLTQDRHYRIARLVQALRTTGKSYWQAEYWTAYLLTAVAKERPVVDSHDITRYLPYTLDSYNDKERDNYIFSFRYGQAEKDCHAFLLRWLDKFGIRAKQEDVGEARLVYDIHTPLQPKVLRAGPPAELPQLELDKISSSEGYLHLVFKNVPSSQELKFLLKVEIPGFCSKEAQFSLTDRDVQIELPIPDQEMFTIRYYFEYEGVKFSASVKDVFYSLPLGEIPSRSERIVFLRGIGPEVNAFQKRQRICEKEASFKFNSPAPGDRNLRLRFYSPFKFSDFRWYGTYVQSVSVTVNRELLAEKELSDGENDLALKIPGGQLKPGGNIVTLKFRYHSLFPSLFPSPIAAILDSIEID